jgi:hypothetical protein
MINELERHRWKAAQEDGVLSGLEFSDQAADCPFDHGQNALRSFWLLGFSIGRSKRKSLEYG